MRFAKDKRLKRDTKTHSLVCRLKCRSAYVRKPFNSASQLFKDHTSPEVNNNSSGDPLQSPAPTWTLKFLNFENVQNLTKLVDVCIFFYFKIYIWHWEAHMVLQCSQVRNHCLIAFFLQARKLELQVCHTTASLNSFTNVKKNDCSPHSDEQTAATEPRVYSPEHLNTNIRLCALWAHISWQKRDRF